MIEGKLVFVLPADKNRPSFNTFYGKVDHMGEDRSGPTCLVKPNGEVRIYDTGTILDVKAVLASFPYEVEFEELNGVYLRE